MPSLRGGWCSAVLTVQECTVLLQGVPASGLESPQGHVPSCRGRWLRDGEWPSLVWHTQAARWHLSRAISEHWGRLPPPLMQRTGSGGWCVGPTGLPPHHPRWAVFPLVEWGRSCRGEGYGAAARLESVFGLGGVGGQGPCLCLDPGLVPDRAMTHMGGAGVQGTRSPPDRLPPKSL